MSQLCFSLGMSDYFCHIVQINVGDAEFIFVKKTVNRDFTTKPVIKVIVSLQF